MCECTDDGISGNISTGAIGCFGSGFPDAGSPIARYCYVKGGAAARCPCANASIAYPGAAYRLCATECEDYELQGITSGNEYANGLYSLVTQLPIDTGRSCAFTPVHKVCKPDLV